MRPAPHLMLLLLLAPAPAQEARQIDWVADWNDAFRLAREAERPVMACINSKDGERANETTAMEIYRDAEFITLSRKFVMVVVSVENHGAGVCPRFGKVTCEDHLQCWKELSARYGDQLATAFAQGEMVSPQHAWFKPDGTLLRRKEYWLEKKELLERMQKVLDELAGKADPEAGGGAEAPPAGPAPDRDAPLTPAEEAELRRIETADKEGRRAAIGNLLATEKTAAHAALLALLGSTKRNEVKCDILRGLGRARVLAARPVVEEHLKDRDELVRSFAAVALEDLGQVESVDPLLKRGKAEKDTMARKNAVRALGACGGPYADKDAAKFLLRAINADKQTAVRKHAALALKAYGSTPEATRLVLKKLEQEAARNKDRWIRGAIVYTLAYIGSMDTTLPVFEKLLQDMNDDYARGFMREAIKVLRKEASEFGRAAWWLFSEDRDDPARTDG